MSKPDWIKVTDHSIKPVKNGSYYCVIEQTGGARYIAELEFDGQTFDYDEWSNDYLTKNEQVTHWIKNFDSLLPDD